MTGNRVHQAVCAKSLQSCLTLCDPMDCSPPGSSVPGILHQRILEAVAMPYSRRSFQHQAEGTVYSRARDMNRCDLLQGQKENSRAGNRGAG